MTCSSCGAANREGREVLRRVRHAAWRAPARPAGPRTSRGERFCGECGTALTADAPRRRAARRRAAERRLVSVLFADLVGFTTLSECARRRGGARAPLALLRHLPAADRALRRHGREVHRRRGHGGLGHADATEDDAERAVRAALDLVAAVSALGDEVGAPELRRAPGCSPARRPSRSAPRARAWSPAISSTRPRGSSPPPSRAPSSSARRRGGRPRQTIAYADAGDVRAEGQGRSPSPLWRALRVVVRRARLAQVARASRRRSSAATASCARSRTSSTRPRTSARRISSPSPASPGSASRGSAGSSTSTSTASPRPIYWHRGRCLSYGEGVTYWALADMVRMRCRIAEDEEPASAQAKLRATLEEHILDPEERGFIEPRWRICSASAEHQARDQQDLSPPGGSSSSAWPRAIRPCSPSRTCSGRTRACSTSSSTCSTGRATTRSS